MLPKSETFHNGSRSADILSASLRSTLFSQTNSDRRFVRAARSGGQDVHAPFLIRRTRQFDHIRSFVIWFSFTLFI
jgi:hypothetical protein